MADDRDVPHLIPPIDSIEDVLIEVVPTEVAPTEDVRSYKRQILGRRGLLHGISFTTTESMGEAEDWLGANCDGKWSLELEDLDVAMKKRTYLALFEHATDKKLFREFLTSQGELP